MGSTKIKLVYGAEPRIGDKTVGGESVYVFDGGVLANSGVMITISLDVGMELTWDSSNNRYLYYFAVHAVKHIYHSNNTDKNRQKNT